jgi:tetratricopeptide (TPR) repeat protein
MDMPQNPAEASSSRTSQTIAELGETERRVLSYAAAMGKEFDFSVLAAATEVEEEKLAEVLEELVHKGVLKEMKNGDAYAFIREDTLNQAYKDISSSRMRVIHRKIGEALEKMGSTPIPEDIPEMGRHFHMGQVYEKSVQFNWHVARQAMKAFSPDVAVHYLEWVREDLPHLTGDHRLDEADVLRELGDQHRVMGDAMRAEQFYVQSLEKLPEENSTLRALILLSRADTARDMDRLPLSRQCSEEAKRLFEAAGHKKGLALAHRELSRAAFKEGELELCRKEIEEAISLLDPEKDASDLARCYIDLGNFYSECTGPDDEAKAIEYMRKAMPVLEGLKDYYELFRAHNNLSLIVGTNNPREALKELQEARTFAEKAMDRRSVGWTLFNSVEFHLALGETAFAEQNNDEARRIFSILNDPLAMEQVTMNAGLLAQHRKDYDNAKELLMEALGRAHDLGYKQDVAEMHLRLAALYQEWGREKDMQRELDWMEREGKADLVPLNLVIYDKLKKHINK